MCRFAHDVVRAGSRAFIASTEEGSIVELRVPSMDLVKTHHLFTTNNHMNALAPLTNGSVWCLLHNRGKVSLPRKTFTYHHSSLLYKASTSDVRIHAVDSAFPQTLECVPACDDTFTVTVIQLVEQLMRHGKLTGPSSGTSDA